jgi:alpha-tubulin suppressor-like RCC1 family protein
VAAGFSHNCALLDSGDVTCWGNDDSNQSSPNTSGDDGTTQPGELIDFNPGDELEFTPVVDLQSKNDTSCALSDEGGLICWGENPYLTDDSVPIFVSFQEVYGQVSEFAVGDDFVCIKDDSDTVSCLGNNDSFQLGGSDAGSSSTAFVDVLAPESE